MNQIAISVENISKQYRLGQVGTGSLAHDVNRAWHRLRGKEDPYLQVGDKNDRTVKASGNYVWALKDINFEVSKGEVLGIIGRNGAGKSTLLKILSRTTSPTTGLIRMKGRIASLLEVGTGFHPELSGRENIFLNGAILGMTRHEVKRKFDEIVEFAGVERYIDTPVKRYSSGMYVRLAFGVAAHLEPEILIVDEVLAVGDAEFQKRCLGKMKDVSEKEGRTVLVVSHILSNISSICDRAMLIDNGTIKNTGLPEDIIREYVQMNSTTEIIKRRNEYFDGNVIIDNVVNFESDINFSFELNVFEAPGFPVFIDFAITNILGDYIVHHKMDMSTKGWLLSPGKFKIDYSVENPAILPGEYQFVLYVYDRSKNVLLWKEQTGTFHIAADDVSLPVLRSPILPKIRFNTSHVTHQDHQ